MRECNVPVIHNWKEFAIYRGPGSPTFLVGQIYNDDMATNGESIRTSTIVQIDRENGIAITKNTLYDLGIESI